jgi:hypothetical protein
VSSFSIRLLGINLRPWDIADLFTIAQCLKLSGQFPDLGMGYRGRDCID